MTTAEVIKYAGYLLSIYQGLRQLVEARGMSPDEFDAQVKSECKRLDGYSSSVADAIADVFRDPK